MDVVFLLAGVFVIAIAVLVLWANPRRIINQAVVAVAAITTLWFALAYQTYVENQIYISGGIANPLRFHRANAAVGCFHVWIFWLISHSIQNPTRSLCSVLFKSIPAFGYCLVLAGLCFHPSFVSESSNRGFHLRGTAYLWYSCLLISGDLWLSTTSYIASRKQVGMRKLELQFVVVLFTLTGVLTVLSHTIGAILRAPDIVRLGIVFVLSGYVVFAWSIAHYRIFNVREVVTKLTHASLSLTAFTASMYGVTQLYTRAYLLDFGFVCTTAAIAGLVLWLHSATEELLDIRGGKRTLRLRGEVIAIGRTEPAPNNLLVAFADLLTNTFGVRHTSLLFDNGGMFGNEQIALSKSRPAFSAICSLGWATPETLLRRRRSVSVRDLIAFLNDYSVGVLIAVPQGSPSPSLVVALGPKLNGAPSTYPDVERLKNIAELMDNILTRSRLTEQATMQAKLEHLAIMSRGLAHDIKNLITPVSSFLIHTKERYESNPSEADVHSAACRAVGIMTEYVRESLFFSERLALKLEQGNIRNVCASAIGIIQARAKARGITIVFESTEPVITLADTVLLERMLTNLLANAIDASCPGNEVRLKLSKHADSRFQITVTDTGSGIAPEHLNRIFDPYFTTKEFGDEVRGFGLGLTIAQKIVLLHNGTISVSSQLGQGTSIIVKLPIVPLVDSDKRVPSEISAATT